MFVMPRLKPGFNVVVCLCPVLLLAISVPIANAQETAGTAYESDNGYVGDDACMECGTIAAAGSCCSAGRAGGRCVGGTCASCGNSGCGENRGRGVGLRCGCNAAGDGTYCGLPAPKYPVPFATPRPTTPTHLMYPPMMPHNSLPHYRSTYSFKHGPGLSRTNVHWRAPKLLNAADYIHNIFEIPR